MDKVRLFENLLAKVGAYFNTQEIELIKKAYEVADKAHIGQSRKTGEEYITHPLAVANILADWETGPDTIAAALLHDVVEDTDYTSEFIQAEFGKDVATMVESLTKISELKEDKKELSNDNFKKIFLAMAKDIRVILIKIADRYDNIKTLDVHRQEKRVRIAKETIDVYSPICHKLGMWKVASEMDDICFEYINPEVYNDIKSRRDTILRTKREVAPMVLNTLRDIAKKNNLKISMYAREKSVYSTYRKIYKKGRDWSEIFDLYAVRVILETVDDCYNFFGKVHQELKPIPNRVKDYISLPKANLYQSIHTTMTFEGHPFELQIRTQSMDDNALGGVASHWRYSKNRNDPTSEQSELEDKLLWLKNLSKFNNENSSEYVEAVKKDVFESRLHVITPAGEAINMPAGSTVLDFAYKLHTDIGDTCTGAYVNDLNVDISRRLRNGEIVKIITDKNGSPDESWLTIANTSYAREKISKKLEQQKQRRKDGMITKGMMMINESKLKINPNAILKKTKGNYSSAEDIIYDIGRGKLSMEEASRISNTNFIGKIFKQTTDNSVNKNIIVESKVKGRAVLQECCQPLPIDYIIGNSVRGTIKVHRAVCPNINPQKKIVNVTWVDKPEGDWTSTIKIVGKTKKKFANRILNAISDLDISIKKVDIAENIAENTTTLIVQIKTSNPLEVVRALSKVKFSMRGITAERLIK